MNNISFLKKTSIISILLLSGCNDNTAVETDTPPGNSKKIEATSNIGQTQNQESQQINFQATAKTSVALGVKYSENTSLLFDESGVSLTVPANYQGQTINDDTFQLTSLDQSSTMLIQPHDQNVNTSVQDMSTTIDLGNGLYLQPLTEVSSDGDTLSARYEVYGSNEPSTAILLKKFRNETLGVFILAITQSTNIENLVTSINELTASIEFVEPTKTTSINQTQTSPDSDNYWTQQFSGITLTNYYSASDYSEKTILRLCANGSYH